MAESRIFGGGRLKRAGDDAMKGAWNYISLYLRHWSLINGNTIKNKNFFVVVEDAHRWPIQEQKWWTSLFLLWQTGVSFGILQAGKSWPQKLYNCPLVAGGWVVIRLMIIKINIFIKSILKSLIILAIWLAFSGVTYSQIALFSQPFMRKIL